MSSIRSARARERSASEPSLQVVSGNFTRERARKTDLDFERDKDKLAHWIGAWKYDEVRVCLFVILFCLFFVLLFVLFVSFVCFLFYCACCFVLFVVCLFCCLFVFVCFVCFSISKGVCYI